MTARIITQITYDAYCPDCGFVVEGFDDEDECAEVCNTHDTANHRRAETKGPNT